jgi:carbon storage regulator
MLVLTRKCGETIFVGHERRITITVVEIRGEAVRLGIDAPREIPVHRSEVFERIQTEERQL